MATAGAEGDPSPLFGINESGYDIQPSFSPNGKWLAYTSSQGGSRVYLVSFPNPQERLNVSSEPGEMPVWSRDGKYYLSQKNEIVAVALQPVGKDLQIGTARVIAALPVEYAIGTMRSLDIVPSERGFLAVLRSDPAIDSISLIENWKAVLKK